MYDLYKHTQLKMELSQSKVPFNFLISTKKQNISALQGVFVLPLQYHRHFSKEATSLNTTDLFCPFMNFLKME